MSVFHITLNKKKFIKKMMSQSIYRFAELNIYIFINYKLCRKSSTYEIKYRNEKELKILL